MTRKFAMTSKLARDWANIWYSNWASGGFVNGASVEDTLDVPHPDIFSGAHSMPTRSRSAAMIPMTGLPQHSGNRISRVGGAEYVGSIVS